VSAVDQHLATRRSAGLFDFSFMGLYEFRGTAALASVQSRDLSKIALGQAAYTLLLNDDGSVFNDATVWNLGADRWWLFTGRRADFADCAPARDRLAKRAPALQGPRAGDPRAAHRRRVVANCVFRLSKRRNAPQVYYSGELGYELLVRSGAQPSRRARSGKAGRSAEYSFEAANTLRIESGYFSRSRDRRQSESRELGLKDLPARDDFL
jgi:glycine cleavage system aminomethyltransferase T